MFIWIIWVISRILHNHSPQLPILATFWTFHHLFLCYQVKCIWKKNIDKPQDIHAGAKHNFGTTTIINILLSLEKAIWQENTKLSAYHNNGKLTCEKYEIDLRDASACIINGPGAPYGDIFCCKKIVFCCH